jgi:hypothetical protein
MVSLVVGLHHCFPTVVCGTFGSEKAMLNFQNGKTHKSKTKNLFRTVSRVVKVAEGVG